MPKVITVENLSKAYQLGTFGTGTISQDLERYWARVRGKEDPFLKIGETNDRTVTGGSNIVWSLKDINFDIEQGSSVGIIGRNGAGKSTLLKILSRITSPTTGHVKVKGRIASLLEVGTGFHPELTGRENIFLNGAVLGMRKSEITRKFDEIVAFSGVERYIDTPVKRYSSGMYVRLAFAVAAHLESEILIVDEVLSVGDAEFQKKCLGKMGDVSTKEGRTVLFVSHNMGAIKKLCNNAILLHSGQLTAMGSTSEIIDRYLRDSAVREAVFNIPTPDEQNFGYATRLQIEDLDGNVIKEIAVGKGWQIRVFFKIIQPTEHFIMGIGLSSMYDINIRTSWSSQASLQEGDFEAVFTENQLILSPGSYHITLGLSNYERPIHYVENVASITVSDVIDPLLSGTVITTNGVGLILNPMNTVIFPSLAPIN